MLFRKKHPVRIEFVIAGQSQPIGYDELPAKDIPEDFEIPTIVEIDGKKFSVKATDPESRKKAEKAGLLKVWVEEIAVPVVEELAEEGEAEEQEEVAVQGPSTYRNASRPAQAPRNSGQRGEYKFVEMMSWQWRQLEFLQRKLAPEIGEELGLIADFQEQAAVDINGEKRYSEQYSRELTQFSFRDLEISEADLHAKYFADAERVDGVAIMGQDGYVSNGFAYVLASGWAVYGQEFEEKVRCMGMIPWGAWNADALDMDLGLLSRAMSELQMVLVDWDGMAAVEADVEEIRAFLADRVG